MLDKYPIELKLSNEVILKIRSDEYSINKATGKRRLEIADSIERLFWTCSNHRLHYIKNVIDKDNLLDKSIKTGLIKSIDLVLSQREFIINNVQFRKSLIPSKS